MYFWGGYAMQLYVYIPYKGRGKQVLAGLAPSRKTVGTILRPPGQLFRPENFCKKSFGKFASMEKSTRLLFDQMNLTLAWFDKVGCYHVTLFSRVSYPKLNITP